MRPARSRACTLYLCAFCPTLGASESRVHVTGKIKFDVTTPRDLQDRALRLKQEVAHGRRVWTAASTQEREEAAVLLAFAVLRQRDPGLLLVLAHGDLDAPAGAAGKPISRGLRQIRQGIAQMLRKLIPLSR